MELHLMCSHFNKIGLKNSVYNEKLNSHLSFHGIAVFIVTQGQLDIVKVDDIKRKKNHIPFR